MGSKEWQSPPPEGPARDADGKLLLPPPPPPKKSEWQKLESKPPFHAVGALLALVHEAMFFNSDTTVTDRQSWQSRAYAELERWNWPNGPENWEPWDGYNERVERRGFAGVNVSIALPNDWPTPHELTCRDFIGDALQARGAGVVIGGGGGCGQMDFDLVLKTDEIMARSLIVEAMEQYLPGYEFEIKEKR